jgi:hypothetical protein
MLNHLLDHLIRFVLIRRRWQSPARKRTLERMRGSAKPISLARKVIIELMHASVPLVVVKRTMNLDRLVKARALQNPRPGWIAILAKAFCLVARDEPWLRTFYLRWPWPHFYELPKTIAMAAIVRDDFDSTAPVILKVGAADEYSLMDVEAIIQRGKNAPLDELPHLKRILRLGRLPLPLRRLLATLGFNIGRQRSNYFGTFAITSVASLGVETVVLRSPGPACMTYGLVHPDHTMELLFYWDHRIYDAILVARALRRLEDVLNTVIADELLSRGSSQSLSA